ncbi:MAG TPA: hypothetical protein PKZ65_04910 [Methanoregulaceae archaeon]|nr:hypothetical protein [Methanoregulaceae archaeon]
MVATFAFAEGTVGTAVHPDTFEIYPANFVPAITPDTRCNSQLLIRKGNYPCHSGRNSVLAGFSGIGSFLKK